MSGGTSGSWMPRHAGHVLVCDDDRNVSRLVESYLEKHGFTVTRANNGLEALQYLGEVHFDAAILDVIMPGIDGFQLLRYIRSEPDTSDLPVIMLTGRSADADVFKGYHYGADVYLTKPFNPSDLLPYIERL